MLLDYGKYIFKDDKDIYEYINKVLAERDESSPKPEAKWNDPKQSVLVL